MRDGALCSGCAKSACGFLVRLCPGYTYRFQLVLISFAVMKNASMNHAMCAEQAHTVTLL